MRRLSSSDAGRGIIDIILVSIIRNERCEKEDLEDVKTVRERLSKIHICIMKKLLKDECLKAYLVWQYISYQKRAAH